MAERRRVRTFEWSTAVIAAVSISAGLTVYVRDGTDKFLAILTNDSWLFVSMLPKMAAGCLIAAFVTRLLPREVVARVVGAESGLLGHPDRDGDGRGAAGRAADHLSGRRRFPRARSRCRHGGCLHHGLESPWLQPRADLGTAVFRRRVRRLARPDRTRRCRSSPGFRRARWRAPSSARWGGDQWT